MEVVAKVKFNASKTSIEKFGANKYLIYLPFERDGDSEFVVRSAISKYIGESMSRVNFKNFDVNKDWVFVIG